VVSNSISNQLQRVTKQGVFVIITSKKRKNDSKKLIKIELVAKIQQPAVPKNLPQKLIEKKLTKGIIITSKYIK